MPFYPANISVLFRQKLSQQLTHWKQYLLLFHQIFISSIVHTLVNIANQGVYRSIARTIKLFPTELFVYLFVILYGYRLVQIDTRWRLSLKFVWPTLSWLQTWRLNIKIIQNRLRTFLKSQNQTKLKSLKFVIPNYATFSQR